MRSTKQVPQLRSARSSLSRRVLLQAGAMVPLAGLVGRAPARAATFPEPSFVRSNGIRMALYEQGTGKVPVVFSHGFPELAYSWRHQLPALADAGFRAIAPDQRGYGRTDRPDEVSAYGMRQLCGDLAGLLDALEIDKAVFCGHDWGGAVVWNMGVLHPDRVLGVIGVNTAMSPRPRVAPTQLLERLLGPDNYIVAFQEPGVAEAALGRDVRKTFRLLLRRGAQDAEAFSKLPADAPERKFQLLKLLAAPLSDDLPGEDLLSEAELEFFVDTFERTGFAGGVNWYRNIDRNWEETADVMMKIEQPCLYVGAADDVVLPPSSANGMEAMVPNLEKVTIPDCGHWTQQEKPEELNKILVSWLQRTFA